MARKAAELTQNGVVGKMQESELSQLEVKLRKKLSIMDYDPIEEKRQSKAKRALLKKINSGKRYRTGYARKEEPEKSDEENEGRMAPKKEATDGKVERERSRHERNAEFKGLSKAKKIKLKFKIKEEAAQNKAKEEDIAEKTNEQIIEELEKEAGEQIVPEKPVEPKKPPKSHSALEIIQHLKSRKQEDQDVVENFLNNKPAFDRFRYHQNNLLSNLLLEDVFKERNIMVQALRYIVKNNFLQDSAPAQ